MKIPLRFARVLGTGFVVCLVGLAYPTDTPAQGKGEKHPHVRAALRELREAKKQLKEAAHDFHGFRAEALRNTNVSIFLLEKALQFDKAGVRPKKGKAGKGPFFTASAPDPVQVGVGERHPHMHRALVRLREAKRNLMEAAHDYGGFRAEAIRTIEVSIFLVEKGLHYDKK